VSDSEKTRSVHVVKHVHNDAGVPIENDEVYAYKATTIVRRKRHQLPLDFNRTGLQSLLQAWRQRSVALELLLEAWRQVAAALG